MDYRSDAGLCAATATRASLPHPNFAQALRALEKAAPLKSVLKRRVWIDAGAVKSAWQRIPAGSLNVRAVEPIGPARIAARRQDIVPEGAIAHRDLGPDIVVGATPWDDDLYCMAGAIGDDRRGRLDDRAACRA